MANNEYTENDALRLLAEKTEGSRIENDTMIIPDEGLAVSIKLVKCQEHNGNFSSQVIFFIEHELFDQPLVESCAGIGKSADEAVGRAVENFCASVMLSVRSALKCDGDEYISTTLMGKEHIFHVPCFTGTMGMGGQFLGNADLWGLVKDVILSYLGCKRTYWVKLFVAMVGDNITCEVRINGVVYHGLTELFRERLPLNGEKTEYGTYKAFVVLIQKEETYIPCPYKAEEVTGLTIAAIEKLKTVHDQESHSKALQDIFSSAPVESLGWEMVGLIPELYCMMVLNLNENDGLMYFKRESKETEYIKTSQLRSYDPIARGVYTYITQRKPSKEENLAVLGSSSLFNSVHKAILDGAKLDDLRCTDIMYSVGEDYKIY